VLYAKGFGFRDDAKTQAVDADTLFHIGSTTKAFTSTLFAMLVDQGKARWDAQLSSYVPGFTLNSSFAASQVTPRDLASHRTGIPRNDLAWVSGVNLTREQQVHALHYFVPDLPFRYSFEYNNFMWETLGFAIEKIFNDGRLWEDHVMEKIFEPVGMKNTKSYVQEAIDSGNYADPHIWYQNSYAAFPANVSLLLQNICPAGCIASNANDMAQWLRFHLNNGTVDGKPLLSAQALQEIYVTEIPVHFNNIYLPQPTGFSYTFDDYAKGWMQGEYRGYRQRWHNGGTYGHITEVFLLPEANIGFFSSTSTAGPYSEVALLFIAYYAIDTLLGFEPWVTVNIACQFAPPFAASTPVSDWRLSILRPSQRSPAYDYSGTYTHPAYGVFSVSTDGTQLLADLNVVSGVLVPGSDSLTFSFEPTGDWAIVFEGSSVPVQFQVSPENIITGLAAATEPNSLPYIFTKV